MVSQILAVVIFVVMFFLIITEKFERHIVTLSCGLLTLTVVFGACMQSMTAVTKTLAIPSTMIIILAMKMIVAQLIPLEDSAVSPA